MKIIAVDNYARESVADILVAENVHEQWAEFIVAALNEKFSSETANRYFYLVEDDRRLSRGMYDLV